MVLALLLGKGNNRKSPGLYGDVPTGGFSLAEFTYAVLSLGELHFTLFTASVKCSFAHMRNTPNEKHKQRPSAGLSYWILIPVMVRIAKFTLVVV